MSFDNEEEKSRQWIRELFENSLEAHGGIGARISVLPPEMSEEELNILRAFQRQLKGGEE